MLLAQFPIASVLLQIAGYFRAGYFLDLIILNPVQSFTVLVSDKPGDVYHLLIII